MVVRVRLFAMLRQRAGRGEVEVELPEGARVADALAALDGLGAGLPLVMAVNRVYARPEDALHPGDELALIPPVSGGDEASDVREWVRVTDQPLIAAELTERVGDPRAGAIVAFMGVTREVPELGYEAYVEMAEPEIGRIVADAVGRHGLCAAAVEHRVGRVALGESSVVVAVSAPHREGAFAGAREIIDEVKARAPIWKRETAPGGLLAGATGPGAGAGADGGDRETTGEGGWLPGTAPAP